MKANIHPVYFEDSKVVCACGNTFTTGSTVQEIRVELCSACHPFFTGQQKFVDTLGQVDKFQKKTETAAAKKQVRVQIQERRAAKTQEEKKDKPSLKDLLKQARQNLHS